MSTISAGTTTTTALVSTGDTTGNLVLATGSVPTTALTLNSTTQAATFAGAVTAPSVTSSGTVNALNTFGFENRIINGGMTIDQRNAGASVTPVNSGYTLDRWYFTLSQASKLTCQQNAGSVTPPAGFTKYLGVTSSSAYTVGASELFLLRQSIEGLNCADLAWGTASAKTITLSAWVRSSLTGTFGGTIRNGAGNRFYPFSYTISSANTWTQISVTIAGDTTGTWATDNSVGIDVMFSLGAGSTVSGTAGSWGSTAYYSVTGAVSVVGTNAATFYITGVQFEVGSQATSFDFRDYGRELILCYRYYQKLGNVSYGAVGTGMIGNDRTFTVAYLRLNADMRAAPTLGFASLVTTDRLGYDVSIATINGTNTSGTTAWGSFTHAATGTAYYPTFIASANTSGFLSLTAEL